jgi:hypothetical protein
MATRCLTLLVLAWLTLSSCERVLQLHPNDRRNPTPPSRQLASIPIIAVGRILANEHIGSARKEDEFSAPIQLCRVTIQIENILRGRIAKGRTAVYYFTDVGSTGASPRLGMSPYAGSWHLGDRMMFFLRRDASVLRTTCDFRDYCVVQVFSGAHPGFKINPDKSIAENIVDLLLTRGADSRDRQMIKAITKSRVLDFSEAYALRKIEQLALDGPQEVTNAACDLLSAYKHPCATETISPK